MEEEIKNKIDEMAKQHQEESIDEASQKAIAMYQENSIQNVQKQVKDGDVDLGEGAKKIANAIGYTKAMEDTDKNQPFMDEFIDKKQKELLASADTALAKEVAEKFAAKRKRNEEFYKSVRPILEMDLSPFLHNSPKKKVKEEWIKGKLIKTEEPEQEEEVIPKKAEYADRSYGIPFMVAMLIVLTIPYMLAALTLSLFNIINAIFVACSRFSKPAFIICSGIAGITLVAIFIYVVLLCIQAAFNVQIIPENVAEMYMINN